MSAIPTYFLDMVIKLRSEEEIILNTRMLETNEDEESYVVEFLKSEYKKELLEYPAGAPEFSPSAALWAAKTVYIAAQLILFRENTEDELAHLFPVYEVDKNVSEVLSADLCLRFLPLILDLSQNIDPSDALLEILNQALDVWHYSGIQRNKEPQEHEPVMQLLEDQTMMVLYVDRIADYKSGNFLKIEVIDEAASQLLGNYKKQFLAY